MLLCPLNSVKKTFLKDQSAKWLPCMIWKDDFCCMSSSIFLSFPSLSIRLIKPKMRPPPKKGKTIFPLCAWKNSRSAILTCFYLQIQQVKNQMQSLKWSKRTWIFLEVFLVKHLTNMEFYFHQHLSLSCLSVCVCSWLWLSSSAL